MLGQTLIGTAGSDTLTGGAGADQLLGGKGTDFLYVDADDTLIDGGDSFDYAYLDSSKSYGANFKVAGTNVEYVGGTAAANVIDATGVSYGTVLFGNYGRDVLRRRRLAAYSGRDTITDSTRGQDVPDMTGYGSGLTSISQLAITSTRQGASIAYGGDSILPHGVAATYLTAAVVAQRRAGRPDRPCRSPEIRRADGLIRSRAKIKLSVLWR